ncbi:MAG: HD domain-containing protein [Lachnospiraceae bacterium]|nr:HD domain-containing protein [Lachnospiraceae bacterium]
MPGASFVRADDAGKTDISSSFMESIINYTNYSMTVYDASNGLMNSSANAIAETKDGFIWIGTSNGLVRYDGKVFERIDPTGSISNVLSLYTDSADRLWIGTYYSGAVVISGKDAKTYDRAGGLESISVRAIAEDKDGNIYLGTNAGIGVVKAADGQLSMVNDERIGGQGIISLRRGSEGAVYGLTASRDVFLMSAGQVTNYISADLFGAPVNVVLPDPESPNGFYAADNEDILYCTLGGAEPVFEAVYSLEYTVDMNSLEMVDGALWVSIGDGLWIINVDRSNVDYLDMGRSMENMLVDYQGNIWFTSPQTGVIEFTVNRFFDYYEYIHHWSIADHNQSNITAVLVKNDRLYVSQNDQYLETYGNISDIGDMLFENVSPVEYIVDNAGKNTPLDVWDLEAWLILTKVHSFMGDSRGRIWLCGSGEYPLLCYNGKYAESYSASDGLPSDSVKMIIERADGSYAAACEGGLALISDNKVSSVYDKDAFLGAEILTLAENAAGELVIGTDGAGLFILEKDGLTHIGTAEGLPSDVVQKVKKDRTLDAVWIIAGDSLAYMTSDRKITTVSGFPYTDNYDLFENDKGDMWVTGSNGIYVVPKSEMMGEGAVNVIHYDLDSGLPFPITPNSYSCLTDEGDLYIAGQKGIIKVNINENLRYYDSIKMSVPYVEADGTRVYPEADGSFVLDSGVKRLTVYGYVCNYTLAEPVITYKLDGFEDEMNTAAESGSVQAVYTNLKGGDYSFDIRLSDPQSGYKTSLYINIIKKLALYEQLWFRIAAGVAAAALVAGVIALYYRHKLKIYSRKAEENKTLVREIVEAFAKVIDMKDKYTNGHSTRVAEYTVLLAEELGCDAETVDKYRNIALMHDIGKVGVPAEVLNKPGKLSDDEYHIIQTHSPLGYDTLKGISIMPDLAEGARSHHERPDGKGYPRGLKGDDIPRVAQIIAVADTFDAMYSNRPYRNRMNFEKAVSIIRENSGTQFEKDVVDAFVRLIEKGKLTRAEDDNGGGTTENIDNIRKSGEG